MTVAQQVTRAGYHMTVSWSGLTGGNSGQPFNTDGWRLVSIGITGTFGADVTISAANDEAGSNTVGLKDRTGTAISASAAGFYGAPDTPLWLFPVAAAGVNNVTVDAHFERIC